MPIDSGEFVLVRKVVPDLAAKGLLQRLTEALGEVFSGGCDNKLRFFIHAPPNNPRQRVINRSAFRFLVEEMLYLLVVRLQEGAREVNKAGRQSFLLFLAAGTCDD
jgi:hypothetical protein